MTEAPTIIGLTGSIGMGKSTTAKLFAEFGIPVWDSDEAVSRLYAEGGKAVVPIQKLFAEAISGGLVSKAALKAIIANDATALKKIEQIVHPLVEEDRSEFIKTSTASLVLVDIPLLFEIGADEYVDVVVVATIDEATQRERVLDRPNMTIEQFDFILSKQMPDEAKRAKADYIVVTDTVEHARLQVQSIIKSIEADN